MPTQTSAGTSPKKIRRGLSLSCFAPTAVGRLRCASKGGFLIDVRINYSPDAVYDAIITKAPASEDFIVLAYASDTGILITGELTNGDPEIAVYQDDDELYREPIIGPEDGLETARDIYDQYLTDRVYDCFRGHAHGGS